MSIKIRNFLWEDLPSLVKLLNEAYMDTYEFTPYTGEGLRSWILEANLKVFVAEENGEVSGSAAYEDGHWGEEIRWLAVLESQNRRALEDALVKAVEKQVKGETVFAVVDFGSPKISDWVERGYKPKGGLYHMTALLNGIKPLPKVPEGAVLRCLKLDEEQKLIETVNASFGFERLKPGVIQKWKSDFPFFSEEWIHVAELNNKIVSVVVAKPDLEYNKSFGGKRGYLGPAATLAEYRGVGFASALTLRAMNFLFEKGMDSVALYTSEENAPSVALLKKLGFKVSHHWKFMRKNITKNV
ncbi:MAG: GNAT family N-acetyltransferase [Candidatus Bathycorpusculaceae bacterium]